MQSLSKVFAPVVILIALAVVIGALYFMSSRSHEAEDKSAVSAVVVDFGSYLKSIPLQEGEEDLKRDIQNNYGRFVTADLLAIWRATPSLAPGRLTSSPWPDHIDIESVTPQGQTYAVSGKLVMLTSSGSAGEQPIAAILIKEDGNWKIAAFEVASGSTTEI